MFNKASFFNNNFESQLSQNQFELVTLFEKLCTMKVPFERVPHPYHKYLKFHQYASLDTV